MAALGALTVAAPSASAQTGGSSQPTGTAPSYYELTLTPPKASALSTFSKARTYSTSFGVSATTTELRAELSLTDGSVTSGAKRGRMANGSKLLKSPLEARVGKSAFAPLNLTVDTPLLRLSGPFSNRTATVNVRQKVEKKVSGRYGKLVLVTLSTDTP